MTKPPYILNDIKLAERYFRSGQFVDAELLLRKIISRDPGIPKAHELLAYISGNRGDLKTCEALLIRACNLPGASGEALYSLGKLFIAKGRPEDAIPMLEQSMRMNGRFFEALHELGVAHSHGGDHRTALAHFLEADQCRPGSWELNYNIGRTLEELHRTREALQYYERSLRLDARQVNVWSNRGIALSSLRQYQMALECYRRALVLAPNDVVTHMNRGVTLTEMGRSVEALTCYDAALAIAPGDVHVLTNKAATLNDLRRRSAAMECYETVLAAPSGGGEWQDYVLGNWLHTKMLLCRWDGLEQAFDKIVDLASHGKKVSPPFPLLATPASQSLLLASFRAYSLDKYPSQSVPVVECRGASPARIHLGYFSADFHNHATSQLMVRLFECHDRSRFELSAFSFGPAVRDFMTDRVAAAFDHFIDVSNVSDEEVASMARSAGIVIAVDLKGFTDDSRPGIFAHRAAPIQVNYLGFPGTMGCDYIDYIIADETLIHPEEYHNYSEKVVLLPGCYQANDDTKRISQSTISREELGLPNEGFVFCCFNNSYKITPDIFDVWMNLLRKTPGSVLWLFRADDESAKSLLAEADSRGIDGSRIIWAEHTDLASHLARYRLADLFLDTRYYNAHTTSSDALWAGLPVLTVEGQTFASRVTASLLKAIGVPQLITQNIDEYEKTALLLANSPESLRAIRSSIAVNREGSSLFNTKLFTRRLESAFQMMVGRLEGGLAPDHFRVDPDERGMLTEVPVDSTRLRSS